jgi:dCTP diphosphatase
MEIEEATRRVRLFADRRDWGQFHTPKNLALALGAEVGELLDLFRWLTDEESHLEESTRSLVKDEIADILIFIVRLADVVGLDLHPGIRREDGEERG